MNYTLDEVVDIGDYDNFNISLNENEFSIKILPIESSDSISTDVANVFHGWSVLTFHAVNINVPSYKDILSHIKNDKKYSEKYEGLRSSGRVIVVVDLPMGDIKKLEGGKSVININNYLKNTNNDGHHSVINDLFACDDFEISVVNNYQLKSGVLDEKQGEYNLDPDLLMKKIKQIFNIEKNDIVAVDRGEYNTTFSLIYFFDENDEIERIYCADRFSRNEFNWDKHEEKSGINFEREIGETDLKNGGEICFVYCCNKNDNLSSSYKNKVKITRGNKELIDSLDFSVMTIPTFTDDVLRVKFDKNVGNRLKTLYNIFLGYHHGSYTKNTDKNEYCVRMMKHNDEIDEHSTMAFLSFIKLLKDSTIEGKYFSNFYNTLHRNILMGNVFCHSLTIDIFLMLYRNSKLDDELNSEQNRLESLANNYERLIVLNGNRNSEQIREYFSKNLIDNVVDSGDNGYDISYYIQQITLDVGYGNFLNIITNPERFDDKNYIFIKLADKKKPLNFLMRRLK